MRELDRASIPGDVRAAYAEATGEWGEDDEAKRAAEVLTEAQTLLAAMKSNPAFARAVRVHLAELKAAAGAAMRATGRARED